MFSRRVEGKVEEKFLKTESNQGAESRPNQRGSRNLDQEADSIKANVYESQTELRETLEQIMDECNLSEKK
jgi:hypothetical protein